MNSGYWNDRYNYYLNNKPPSATSYYNKSFADEINKAQQNIDNLVAEKDKAWSAQGQKQDEYNAFQGNMSSYGDVYKNAEDEFGVKEFEGSYEKNKKALALAESTLSALPSTINSSSNRVLTQAQREARYNTLSNKFVKYRDNLLARSSAYEQAWKNARENQSEYAKKEMVAQYSKLSDYNNAYITAMNNYLTAQQKVNQAEITKTQWEQGYRSWQEQQYANEYSVWLGNLNAALTRYNEAISSEMAAREYQRQIEAMYAGIPRTNSYDFGNGYSIKGTAGGEAEYYKDGQRITAGKFLEGTGSRGINWDMWNNVWNSGIKTNGVGSDTVSAFNGILALNRRFDITGKYSYLF